MQYKYDGPRFTQYDVYIIHIYIVQRIYVYHAYIICSNTWIWKLSHFFLNAIRKVAIVAFSKQTYRIDFQLPDINVTFDTPGNWISGTPVLHPCMYKFHCSAGFPTVFHNKYNIILPIYFMNSISYSSDYILSIALTHLGSYIVFKIIL